jgi:hypothetical protein
MDLATWEILAKAGQALGGLSLAVAAGMAVATLLLVHTRTGDREWVEGFRDMYAEFWKDDDIAEVRRWIVSEVEYPEIHAILSKRLKSNQNWLDESANKKLEKIDKFCSLLTRMHYFCRLARSKQERDKWQKLYVRYWVDRIHARDDFRDYMLQFWESTAAAFWPGEVKKAATNSARK